MNEKDVKKLIRDWMYNWGYYPKNFSSTIYPIELDSILSKGKMMIPFYDLSNYKRSGTKNCLIIDDIFELVIPLKVEKCPFKIGESFPENIAFEYKGYRYDAYNLYTSIGQSTVYYYLTKQPIYLVIDIENYLKMESVFNVLPFGIICYRIKNIESGIKVFKYPIPII